MICSWTAGVSAFRMLSRNLRKSRSVAGLSEAHAVQASAEIVRKSGARCPLASSLRNSFGRPLAQSASDPVAMNTLGSIPLASDERSRSSYKRPALNRSTDRYMRSTARSTRSWSEATRVLTGE